MLPPECSLANIVHFTKCSLATLNKNRGAVIYALHEFHAQLPNCNSCCGRLTPRYRLIQYTTIKFKYTYYTHPTHPCAVNTHFTTYFPSKEQLKFDGISISCLPEQEIIFTLTFYFLFSKPRIQFHSPFSFFHTVHIVHNIITSYHWPCKDRRKSDHVIDNKFKYHNKQWT